MFASLIGTKFESTIGVEKEFVYLGNMIWESLVSSQLTVLWSKSWKTIDPSMVVGGIISINALMLKFNIESDMITNV